MTAILVSMLTDTGVWLGHREELAFYNNLSSPKSGTQPILHMKFSLLQHHHRRHWGDLAFTLRPNSFGEQLEIGGKKKK